MSVNFSTLQGLTIPQGMVTQIADASGRVLWSVASGNKVILEVKKIKSQTYADSSTYLNDNFILLDIYPKTNGTVSVTYGGLTKTITDTSGVGVPNAQQVFFGTFNNVSDSIFTPSSGRLTISGNYNGFGAGTFKQSKNDSARWTGIIAFIDWGDVARIEDSTFSSVINSSGTMNISGITSIVLPETLIYIGDQPFGGMSDLTSVTFEDPEGWYEYYTDSDNREWREQIDVSNAMYNADRLTEIDVTRNNVYWYKQTQEA